MYHPIEEKIKILVEMDKKKVGSNFHAQILSTVLLQLSPSRKKNPDIRAVCCRSPLQETTHDPVGSTKYTPTLPLVCPG